MAFSQGHTDFLRFTAAGDVATGNAKQFLIKSINWSQIAATGAQLQLSDTAGNIFYDSKAGALDDHYIHFDTPIRVDGIVVATLTSGVVTVYL